MHRRRPLVTALLAAVVLGLAACGEATRVDEEEEPTILQPNVDDIVTEGP